MLTMWAVPPPGDMQRCQETLLVVTAGVLREIPQFKDTPRPKINSVKADKLARKDWFINPGGKGDAHLCAADHKQGLICTDILLR